MTFESWLARLRHRGFVTCPTSSAIPVDLKAVTVDGTGLHFRCRGVRVFLRVYRPGRAAWQTPLRDDAWSPEETLELWEHRPLRGGAVPDGGRLVFVGDGPSGQPDAEIVLDGARSRGWRGHEAGLLRAAEAAAIFETMLVVAGLVTKPGVVRPGPAQLPHQPLGQPGSARTVPPHPLPAPVPARSYATHAATTGVGQTGRSASESQAPPTGRQSEGGGHPLAASVL